MDDLRVFSFGGGVQSMAVLCRKAQHRIQYNAFIFANVGADSENPETLEYIENYVKPFCDQYDQNYVEVQRTRKTKEGVVQTTLLKELERAEKSIIIPMRMSGNGAPGNRNCTTDFKIRVIDKWVKTHEGITPESHVVVGLGISTDEFQRARDTEWHNVESETAKHPRKIGYYKRREYPLIELRINRLECISIIQEFGLPVPPKSSCYFCPYHTRATWQEMLRRRPDLFANAVAVEKLCNEKRVGIGRDDLFLHPSLVPLDQAVQNQMTISEVLGEEEDGCADGGYCMV